MELKIQAKDFQEAIDIAFRDYGVTSNEILDFNEFETGVFTLTVNKTIDSEIRLNNEVKSLIKSGNFASGDIAFVCSDNEVHTPAGDNLFERVKSLVRDGFIPIVGYDNFIIASDEWSTMKTELDKQPVAYNDLILTKEGNLLKGTKFKTARKANSNFSDPVFEVEIDCGGVQNQEQLINYFDKIMAEAKIDNYAEPYAEDGKVRYLPIAHDPMEALNILFIAMKALPGIKRFKISNEAFQVRGDMK